MKSRGTCARIRNSTVAAVLCGAWNAYAQPLVMGADLHRFCNDDLQTAQTFCMGYVGGVTDLIQERFPAYRGCLAKVDGLQQVDIVKRYLFNNPERRNVPAATLVADAVVSALRCEK